jgi:hypothetical protein
MSLSFAVDILPLFTAEDIEHMDFVFDLSSYDDVVANAREIYERLAEKTMPPGDPWSDADIAKFRQWIDDGMNP